MRKFYSVIPETAERLSGIQSLSLCGLDSGSRVLRTLARNDVRNIQEFCKTR